jgi:solute carrier family 25 phosphate transporter 3
VYKSISTGMSIASKEGALLTGWVPTLIGYSAQGCFKFGLYEIFKDLFSQIVGAEAAYNNRTLVYLAASASAEVFADAALCPFEAIKVRMQTSLPSANFPLSIGPAYAKITEAEGFGGLYKGLVPLWGRQVPYTMVKFSCFEKTVEAFYTYVFTEPKSSYSKSTQLSITFASGYIAGVLCAVVSQPADTLVSKLNQSPGAALGEVIAKAGGLPGLYKGLGMRIIMVGTLTGLQWWIYDGFKTVSAGARCARSPNARSPPPPSPSTGRRHLGARAREEVIAPRLVTNNYIAQVVLAKQLERL